MVKSVRQDHLLEEIARTKGWIFTADINDREVINNVTEYGSWVTRWGNVSFPLHVRMCTGIAIVE